MNEIPEVQSYALRRDYLQFIRPKGVTLNSPSSGFFSHQKSPANAAMGATFGVKILALFASIIHFTGKPVSQYGA
jgi:hypothetical protein